MHPSFCRTQNIYLSRINVAFENLSIYFQANEWNPLSTPTLAQKSKHIIVSIFDNIFYHFPGKHGEKFRICDFEGLRCLMHIKGDLLLSVRRRVSMRFFFKDVFYL